MQQKASLTSSPYPFAAAPDIIRARQKDAYFCGILTHQVSDLHRRFVGARSSHAWQAEARTFADLLYHCLTTLLGNRTLGEEYCGLVSVEAATRQTSGGPRLPSAQRRAGYIFTSILLPYLGSRILPKFLSRLRELVPDSKTYRATQYLLEHLAPSARAVTLTLFYFTGAYYSLSKRLFRLRYVFTRRLDSASPASSQRAGYEVLGLLLMVQMAVRVYLNLREHYAVGMSARQSRAAVITLPDLSLGDTTYSSNNALLVDGHPAGDSFGRRGLVDMGALMHTPVLADHVARHDLHARGQMAWIAASQQRKCTLCLDAMCDPAAMQCGHVFCWTCIRDWIREKPECPLCRREAMVQHILPLRSP